MMAPIKKSGFRKWLGRCLFGDGLIVGLFLILGVVVLPPDQVRTIPQRFTLRTRDAFGSAPGRTPAQATGQHPGDRQTHQSQGRRLRHDRLVRWGTHHT